MNDEQIERHLRDLPVPELPAAWRAEILAAARRKSAAVGSSRRNGPTFLLVLRRLFVRNPVTAGALAVLWMLILLFHATTPVDPAAQEMLARVDPNRPVYLVDLATEIRLAEILENPSDERPTRIP